MTNKEKMAIYTMGNTDIGNAPDVYDADCDNILHIFENCNIEFKEVNKFFATVDCDRLQIEVAAKRASLVCDKQIESRGLDVGYATRSFTGAWDFSHTCPMWEDILSLGVYGLYKRVLDYAEKSKGDDKKQRYFAYVIRVYEGLFSFMGRFIEKAYAEGKEKAAQSMKNLLENAPSNLYEAMQTIILYYFIHHMVEGTNLRTLGRLDKLLLPFFEKEEKENAKKLLCDFVAEIDTLEAPANIPFAICGTGIDGKEYTCELSYLLLWAYDMVETVNTKLHILYSDKTPADIVKTAFEMIRRGKNSIVFMADDMIVETLVALGAKREHAANYHIVGCYEPGAEQELTCTCNGRVSLPKVLEAAMNNGRDILTGKKMGLENDGKFESFEDFFCEFERQLEYFIRSSMEITAIFESNYNKIHSSPFFSSTYTSSLENGGDIYCDYSARYNNSSINALGIGTAADSLYAVKKLVFEDKTLTLSQYVDILKANWQGNEALRLTVMNKFKKYGTGDAELDSYAKRMVESLAKNINGKPNAKGGRYRLGTYSIDWRWDFGEHTAATPDGRLCGETISQNSSASFGMDKEGATAHILSVTSFPHSITPNGSIIDIDLHSSSVKGEAGISTLVATLKTYVDRGGMAIHYNVLDTETLKKAKERPEDYPNLQVRLCGWNVLFSSLSEKEKDEFIARSMK